LRIWYFADQSRQPTWDNLNTAYVDTKFNELINGEVPAPVVSHNPPRMARKLESCEIRSDISGRSPTGELCKDWVCGRTLKDGIDEGIAQSNNCRRSTRPSGHAFHW
jgi:hypothetical protein